MTTKRARVHIPKVAMWECEQCGGRHDAMKAWVDTDRVKLWHKRDGRKRPMRDNLCGPLIAPDRDEFTKAGKRKKRKGTTDVMIRSVSDRSRRSAGATARRRAHARALKDTRTKPCGYCGEEFGRKLRPSGNYESVKEFTRRECCSVKCGHRLRAQRLGHHITRKRCVECTGWFDRGENQGVSNFKRQEYCSDPCRKKGRTRKMRAYRVKQLAAQRGNKPTPEREK